MKCERCEQEMVNPVEHEWCTPTHRPHPVDLNDTKLHRALRNMRKITQPFTRDDQVEFGGRLPHHYKKQLEALPTQNPILNHIAPLEAKPPIGSPHSHHKDAEEDGPTDHARKVFEEL